jgi:hypothetical membrane protein
MVAPVKTSRLTAFSLLCGIAGPLIYFGCQLAAAPFYPGYSFLTNSASQLGSDRSTFPAILNGGAILSGVAMVLAAIGYWRELPRAGSARVWTVLTCLALVSAGAAGVWAGSFPLPDPRHNPKLLGAGSFVLPLLLAIALRKSESRPLRAYLIADTAAFLLLLPVMSGAAGIDIRPFYGVLQRVAAAVLYIPIGVVAAFLLRRR